MAPLRFFTSHLRFPVLIVSSCFCISWSALTSFATTSEAGGQEGESAAVIETLEHHLVDSPDYEIFGIDIHLPTIHLAGYTIQLTKHMLMLIVAGLLLILLIATAYRKKRVVPHGLANFFEVIVVFLRDEVVQPNLGEESQRFMPYFLTLFFFILFGNLLGLVPWGASPTGNINMTAGLASLTLLLMIVMGIIKQGPIGYLRSFIPPGVPIFIVPIILPIEIIGLFIKPFALTMRLFANMLGGHAVVAAFLGLIATPLIAPLSIAGAVAISLLEIFVAFLQAYIFVILSAVFIGMSMHPSH
jgi:F-type H+-transporting ATPase subunit a